MAKENLLEQCVISGLVVRDDRTRHRLPMVHGHWKPTGNKFNGEALLNYVATDEPYPIRIHATVCLYTLTSEVRWLAYGKARETMFGEFPEYTSEFLKGRPSFNISLDRYLEHVKSAYLKDHLNKLYDAQVTSLLNTRFYELVVE